MAYLVSQVQGVQTVQDPHNHLLTELRGGPVMAKCKVPSFDICQPKMAQMLDIHSAQTQTQRNHEPSPNRGVVKYCS